jgi:hypothetical protein
MAPTSNSEVPLPPGSPPRNLWLMLGFQLKTADKVPGLMLSELGAFRPHYPN